MKKVQLSQLGAACKAVFHNEDMLVKLFDIVRMFIIKNSQMYVLQFGEYAPGCFYVILSKALQPVYKRVMPDVVGDSFLHLGIYRAVACKFCKNRCLKLRDCHGLR